MLNQVIIACAGPSLFPLDLCREKRPCLVAAVSTAIQSITRPDFWFFLDRPNKNYGKNNGAAPINDNHILKVVPDRPWARKFCTTPEHQFKLVPLNFRDPPDAKPFNGLPLLKATHQSTTLSFAVQWLVYFGFNRIHFAGLDLKGAGLWNKERISDQQKVHDQCLDLLRKWTPLAAEKGVEFVSLTPNSPINEFMPYREYHSIAEPQPEPLVPCPGPR